MPTSSITKSFVIETEEQVEKFIKALEESYQESLTRERPNVRAKFLTSSDEILALMAKREKLRNKKHEEI